jgi:hypothetical protein
VKPKTKPNPPPAGGGMGVGLGLAGLGLAGAGASAFLPSLIGAGANVGMAGIAGDTAKDVAHTLMNGVQAILGDVASNPMALGAIVASVGVVAYISVKK